LCIFGGFRVRYGIAVDVKGEGKLGGAADAAMMAKYAI
jgi:hypothetical protein